MHPGPRSVRCDANVPARFTRRCQRPEGRTHARASRNDRSPMWTTPTRVKATGSSVARTCLPQSVPCPPSYQPCVAGQYAAVSVSDVCRSRRSGPASALHQYVLDGRAVRPRRPPSRSRRRARDGSRRTRDRPAPTAGGVVVDVAGPLRDRRARRRPRDETRKEDGGEGPGEEASEAETLLVFRSLWQGVGLLDGRGEQGVVRRRRLRPPGGRPRRLPGPGRGRFRVRAGADALLVDDPGGRLRAAG